MEQTFERLIANLAGAKPRRAVLNGRSYLVAPATLIVPGVLNGSRGPLLYKPDLVERKAPTWNGIPIVVRHPKDDNGRHVSAKSPGILDKYGIGFVFESTWNVIKTGTDGAMDDGRSFSVPGKHASELWFDEEATRNFDLKNNTRILASVESGSPIELSTGLFTAEDEAPVNSTWNGKPYTDIVVDYTPDHLAILPDEVGACSIRDGCGVFNGYNTTAELVKIGEWLKNSGQAMPGYGQIFIKENGSGEAWYVGGDGDEDGFSKLVKKKISGVSGIDEVTYESEGFPPKDQGWVQVYPKQRNWTANEEDTDEDRSTVSKFFSWLLRKAGRFSGNSFCPRGKGRGVDPSCSPPGGGSGGASKEKTKITAAEMDTRISATVSSFKTSKSTVGYGSHKEEIHDITSKSGKEVGSISDRRETIHQTEGGGSYRVISARHKDGTNLGHYQSVAKAKEALAKYVVEKKFTTNDQTDNAGRFGNPQSTATGRYKPTASGTGKGDVHEAAQRGSLVLTDRDRELGASAKTELEATGSNPASWVADEGKWDKAKAAADKGNYSGDTYWAVVASIYQKMGGTIKQKDSVQKDSVQPEPTKNAHKCAKCEAENKECDCSNETGDADMTQKLTPNQRQDIIKTLTTNCDCWKEQQDIQLLSNFSDEKLQKLQAALKRSQEQEAVVNEVKELAVNAGAPEGMTANEFPDFLKKKMGKGAKGDKGDKGEKGDKGDPDDDEEDDDEAPSYKKGKQMTGNDQTNNGTPRKQTMAEWEANMPQEARAVWNTAKTVERRAREQATQRLQQIAANTYNERKKTLILNKLKTNPALNELEEILALVEEDAPTENQDQGGIDGYGGAFGNIPPAGAAYVPQYQGRPVINYTGNGGGAANLTDNEEILDMDAAREQYEKELAGNKA